MSNDGKIYIYITDKAPNDSKGGVINNSGNKAEKKNENDLFSHWARNRLINTTRSLISNCVDYSLSNVGNFTGDYITQAKINDTLSNINALSSIGMSALSGFAVGGFAGAIMGATLGAINTGVSSALNIKTQMVANSKTNYEIARLRERAGLNTLLDGGRGTEN